jgi:hypothetical protein
VAALYGVRAVTCKQAIARQSSLSYTSGVHSTRINAAWLLVGMLLVVPRPTAATTCAPVSLLTHAAQAAAILEATVVAHTPMGATAGFERRYRVELTDVYALKGEAVRRLVLSSDWLKPGRRYLIFATRSPNGELYAGLCGGPVVSSARIDGYRSWLASLSEPSTGGRIFGSVVVRPWGDRDPSEWPAVSAAMVTARGPVTVRTVADSTGQFAFGGLPDGEYQVSVAAPTGREDVLLPKPISASLHGDHAAAALEFVTSVNGSIAGAVVDEQGTPVANTTLFLHAGPGADESARGRYGLVTTDARGAYVAQGVAPGHYLLTLADPYLPAHAQMNPGQDEIVIGWGERVQMQPLVARHGEVVDPLVTVVDADGRPVEEVVIIDIVGPYGLLPRSGPRVETNLSGAFPLRLLRGVRYRLSVPGRDETSRASVEYVADGSPVRIVLPR